MTSLWQILDHGNCCVKITHSILNPKHYNSSVYLSNRVCVGRNPHTESSYIQYAIPRKQYASWLEGRRPPSEETESYSAEYVSFFKSHTIHLHIFISQIVNSCSNPPGWWWEVKVWTYYSFLLAHLLNRNPHQQEGRQLMGKHPVGGRALK